MRWTAHVFAVVPQLKEKATGKSLYIHLLLKKGKSQSTWDLKTGDSSLKAKIEGTFEGRRNKIKRFSLRVNHPLLQIQREVKHDWLIRMIYIQPCMGRNH